MRVLILAGIKTKFNLKMYDMFKILSKEFHRAVICSVSLKYIKNMQSLQCTASCSSFLIYDPFRIFLPLRGVKSLLKCQIFHKHGNSSRYCNAESLQAKSSLGPKCPIVLVLCSSLGVQAYLNFK